MKNSKLYSWVLALAAALFVLSAAIAVPILCRPFYFAHIEPYNLAEGRGLTVEQVKDAFNEVLDYCIGRTDEFGTGILVWSESGRDHFADCKELFLLDFRVLAGSTAVLLLLFVLWKMKKTGPALLGRRRPVFWSGLVLCLLFVFVGAALLIDPDAAFVAFHHIFFPGKTNWLFDYRTDSIILILPEEYFIHCGILIAALILLAALGMMVYGRKRRE